MTVFEVKGICTVTKIGIGGYPAKFHLEKINVQATALDEVDAVDMVEVLAIECAELNSGFDRDWCIASEVKIDSVREVPECEILLNLPRELAPMLPGF